MPINEVEVIARAKAELRKRLRALRQTTPASACAARSARIVERLRGLDVVANAKSIALFWPMEERHEVDLRALDTALRTHGVAVAYPFIDDATREMSFRIATPQELLRHSLGFHAAPSEATVASALDVIVVPGLAFDEHGKRLGLGGGHYDRALARMPSAITVGVAYDFQLLAEVPSLAHDIAVRWVVTDARTLSCAAPSA